jgi:hypothetical protein
MSIRDKLISGPLGFGSAPLGNMFRNIPAEEAAATVDAAQQFECWFDGRPIRDEYLIVEGGKLAGTGARSYTVGAARNAAAATRK